jgi:hypothetical protein
MAVVTEATAARGQRSIGASLDIDAPAEATFALLCAIEKWPVWLSFLRSANPLESGAPLSVGSDVVVRSSLPRDEEQLYEVDALITNYHLSLVGAFSVRRRFDFRIESKIAGLNHDRSSWSKLHVRLSYPAYHGRVGAALDGWLRGRKLAAALNDALVHFKGLVEYRRDDAVLADL